MPPVGVPDVSFLERLSEFQVPTQVECLDYLSRVPIMVSVPMLIGGVVYLLFGWKLHKLLVVANAMIAGAVGGALLGQMADGDKAGIVAFGAAAGGLMFGVLALPLIRGAVSLTGMIAGGLIGFVGWEHAVQAAGRPELADHAWTGALIGCVALGLLAYANFRLAVMIFTAAQGAAMTVAAAVSLLLLNEETCDIVRGAAENGFHLAAAAVVVPAVIGLALQHADASKKIRRKLKPSAAPA